MCTDVLILFLSYRAASRCGEDREEQHSNGVWRSLEIIAQRGPALAWARGAALQIYVRVLGRATALRDAAQRRRAHSACERGLRDRGIGSSPVHVPNTIIAHAFKDAIAHAPAEILVEGRGAVEHHSHMLDAVDRPTTDVLVEDQGATKHTLHICDIVDCPIT